MTPKIPLEKRQQITGNKSDMRHRAEHQCKHQKIERIFLTRTSKRVTPKCAERKRDYDNSHHNDDGVQSGQPKFFSDPGAVVPFAGKCGPCFDLGSHAANSIGPIRFRKKVTLNLKRSPKGPKEWETSRYDPDHNKAPNNNIQNWRTAMNNIRHQTTF